MLLEFITVCTRTFLELTLAKVVPHTAHLGNVMTPLIVTYVPIASLSEWSFAGLVFAKFTFGVAAYVYISRHRRSTPHDVALPGASASTALLAYGGQNEDIMVELLDAGLDLGEINEPQGY